MEREEIFDRVRAELAATLELDEDDVLETSNLMRDLGADSLDLLELILMLKAEFDIAVEDGEVKLLLAELAQFLPDVDADHTGSLSDEQLADVARSLTVGTVVDFVAARRTLA